MSTTRLIALFVGVAVGMSAAGCVATGQRRRTAYVIDGATAVAGGLLIGWGATRECDVDLIILPACGGIPQSVAVIGGVMAVAGVSTLIATAVVNHRSHELPPGSYIPPAPPDPTAVPIQPFVSSGRADVDVYTKEARLAARAGHCEAVDRLADRVRDRDGLYFQAHFVADPSIAECLRRAQ